MLKLSAMIDKRDIENLLKTYSGPLVKKSIRSALDRTGTWAKNHIAQDISENYNINSARVKKAIKVQRTTQSKMETTLNITGSPLSVLDDFKAIQDAQGIRANIRRNQETVIPHAFINVARNSGKRVIMKRKGKPRYPTTGKPGRGPSIPTLVDRLANREKRNAALQNHLYQELEQQLAKRTMQVAQTAEIE